ncbi:MAG TPA: transporter substrate-binding domain-containing protein [Anaerolineae bacterium]|nr:transporter substrate-binding domain-containing protein [Anaerolineae bacterium]
MRTGRFVLALAGLMALLLSTALSSSVVTAAPLWQDEGQEYVVQADDWLSKLAEKFYGDPLAWTAIYEATNTRSAADEAFTFIADPNVIEVGQKLWIPATEEATVAVAEFAAQLPTGEEVVGGGALADILQRGYFTYGLEAQYRPFEFRDENENIVGYDIDIASEIGKRLGGVEARPVDTSWPTVIQTLYDGGFDFILGGMTATEERYERVNFSVPYMDASSGLLVRADAGITERAGLDGKVVGAGEGTPSVLQLEVTAEELGISYGDEIKTYDDDAAAYDAMRAGRIDAYASSTVSLLEFVKENPEFTVIPFKSDRWAAEYSTAAFRKEDEALRAAFNEILVQMKTDGTLAQLQEKWFGATFDVPNVPPTW